MRDRIRWQDQAPPETLRLQPAPPLGDKWPPWRGACRATIMPPLRTPIRAAHAGSPIALRAGFPRAASCMTCSGRLNPCCENWDDGQCDSLKIGAWGQTPESSSPTHLRTVPTGESTSPMAPHADISAPDSRHCVRAVKKPMAFPRPARRRIVASLRWARGGFGGAINGGPEDGAAIGSGGAPKPDLAQLRDQNIGQMPRRGGPFAQHAVL